MRELFKITKERTIDSLFISIAVGIALTLTATIKHNSWSVDTVYSLLIALATGFVIPMIIPIAQISKWFGGLFKFKNPYPAIIVGDFMGNFVVTILMALVMTAFAMRNALGMFWQAFGSDFALMLLSSYLVSLLVNVFLFYFRTDGRKHE